MGDIYYLGANSGDGFRSLYRYFAAGPGDRLHVIKGGPGTGKSSLMRRIGREAEKRGLNVDYVLCSGDPDSLDGVYLPALRQGWVDGTAPHVVEPALFGADGDYLDLGQFCRLPLAAADEARARSLGESYRARYAAAYRILAAAAALRRTCLPVRAEADFEQKLRRRIRGILQRHAPRGACGAESRRYLSAISCRGLLKTPLPEACSLAYRLDEGRGLAPRALQLVAEEAEERGLGRILCPLPLDETQLEAVLLPEAGLAFTAGDWEANQTRGIRLDAMLPPPEAEERRRLRLARQREQETIDEAVRELARAKALHDELEGVFRPYMDFAALDTLAERTIRALFG